MLFKSGSPTATIIMEGDEGDISATSLALSGGATIDGGTTIEGDCKCGKNIMTF